VAARTYQQLELRNSVSVTPLADKQTDPTLRVQGYRGSELAYDGFVTVAEHRRQAARIQHPGSAREGRRCQNR
jgi:hypothetical protein